MTARRIQSAYSPHPRTMSKRWPRVRDGHVAADPVAPRRPCMARTGGAKVEFGICPGLRGLGGGRGREGWGKKKEVACVLFSLLLIRQYESKKLLWAG